MNAGLLYSGLRRSGVLHLEPEWPSLLVRVIGASAVMGLLLYMGMGDSGWWLDSPVPERVSRLGWLVPAGLVTYFIVLVVSGVPLKSLLSGRGTE